jgi:hypothetical protein
LAEFIKLLRLDIRTAFLVGAIEELIVGYLMLKFDFFFFLRTESLLVSSKALDTGFV